MGAAPVTADGPELTCGGVPATIVGTGNGATIYGADGPDVIVGTTGADTIYGLGGYDLICGAPDPTTTADAGDTIYGGEEQSALLLREMISRVRAGGDTPRRLDRRRVLPSQAGLRTVGAG